MYLDIIDNLKIADYVTTTTDLFANEIRKQTGKDNVFVFPNSVNPDWMRQFQDNRKIDEKYTRITYMAGSSHKNDIQQLDGVANLLSSTENVGDKFKFILAGWDTEGTTTDFKFNQEFATVLQKRRLWDAKMIKSINNSKGNVDLIEGLPKDLREAFRNNVFSVNQRAIKSEESVYLDYEKTLTDNYRIIKSDDYKAWLGKYERDKYYDAANVNYERRWTQKANIYAQVLDETDISLAPLADNLFNRMKSNLKQVEVWTRRLPIVCSDIPPYNVDGKHMKNCILVPYKKGNDRDWYKAIKKLISEPNLREDLGNQLYEDFKVKYNLKHVTEARAQFYSTIATIYSLV
jgi:glycosyltransferase involved in cell wall biosynthesis